jgi:hypothetical protein
MSVNNIIREADYNSIRNKLANIIGVGSGDSGWGQTLVSSAVSVGNRVSINEWGRLRFDIINAWTHIYGSAPTTVQVVEGNTIRSSVVDAPYTTYDTIVNTIVANKFVVHSSQASLDSVASSSTAWPGPYGTSWKTRIQCTVTVSWPTANAARHFFNSGGQIRLASAQSGGNGSQQVSAWRTLLTNAGTRQFGGNNPGTGISPSNGQNWYRLTNSYQQWYTISGSTPYGANNYRILARCNVANNSTGTASSAEFLVEFNDNYIDPDVAAGRSELFNPPGDNVDGTFTVSASSLYATGILVPLGTGSFSVTRPTIQVGVVSP